MKRMATAFIALCVLVMGLVSCGGVLHSSPPLSVPQLVSHEGNSTVALVFTDIDNDDDEVSDVRPTCTAVWVDDHHILTALHCAKGEQKRQQKRQDEKEANRDDECSGLAALLGFCDPNAPKEHKTIELKGLSMHYVAWKEVDDVRKEPTAQHLAHVVGWDQDHDLALLEAAGHAVPPHEIAVVAKEVPGMGERVHVVGHPKGMYWTFLEGTMAGYRGDIPGLQAKKLKEGDYRHHGPYMQVQIPIYFGNSGGGAFNDAGELIGIADFLMNLPSEGFFVPVDPIRAFLVDQEVLPGKVKKEEPKKEEKPVVNVTVVTVTPPAAPAEKADVIPAPPLPIPLPKLGGLGNVPTP